MSCYFSGCISYESPAQGKYPYLKNKKTNQSEIQRQIIKEGYWQNPDTKYAYEVKQLTHLSRIRSIYKTISWRVLATTDTFIISYFITGYFGWAISIASIEVCTKMGLYYLHERGWALVRFKRPW